MAADGSWAPAQTETVSGTGDVYTVSVPAGSAMLVGFGGGTLRISQ